MFSAFNSSKNNFFIPGLGTIPVDSLEAFINHPKKYEVMNEIRT